LFVLLSEPLNSSPASEGFAPDLSTEALPLDPAGGTSVPQTPSFVPVANSWLRPCTQANNLGVFYKYINQRVRHRQAVAALIDADGLVITSDEKKGKSNIFNNYFAPVSTIDDGTRPSSNSTKLCS